MSRRDLSNTDASTRANSELDVVLRRTQPNTPEERKISVEEALRQARVGGKKTNRSAARVLFISQDTTLLNPETQSLDGYLQLNDLFEEVHILILRTGIPAKNPVLRVSDNVWLYTASARAWWLLPMMGVDLLEQELVFAQGFRPDLIVARDPFESGLVGRKLAQKYNRPLQVHVLTNYTGERFKEQAAKNAWRRFLPRFTLAAALSVRADTEVIQQVVKERFSVPDVALLPKFHSYEAVANTKPAFALTDKYQNFVFFFLYVGTLDAKSAAFRAIDAARFSLQNPRVGLIILGDGPAKSEFQKRAKILGIDRQVIFETNTSDVATYLKGAQVLIAPDTNETTNEVLLQAAAVGLPAVMAKTEQREDWFESGTSGILCEPDDTVAFTNAAGELFNGSTSRKTMGEYAKEVIAERFHESPDRYREEYRRSIEETIFVEREETEAE